jgi:muramoyltetrapeptide carboxypeptidase LdcA involved in peptidoglycan recycling
MDAIVPPKLKSGDTVRVVAPACSLAMIGDQVREIANRRLGGLGLTVTFGRHVEERDVFLSSSVASRVEDLHEAFADPEVAGILSVIGGYNSNGLLRSSDWALIGRNPKVICGYSDITALSGAMLRRCGLVTYSGPHYSTFGQKLHAEYTVESFQDCLMRDEPYQVEPSAQWSDDAWYLEQEDRTLVPNTGYLVLREGEAEGQIVGGNLCTLNLLQGTEYMPSLKGAILFVEDDFESHPETFDRDLQSLLHQPGVEEVGGLVIGRFQRESHMTDELLAAIVASKHELRSMPVVGNADFGHTDPKLTFPIGGMARIAAGRDGAQIEILRH